MGIVLVRAVQKLVDQDDRINACVEGMIIHREHDMIQKRHCQEIYHLSTSKLIPPHFRRKYQLVFAECGGIERIVDILETITYDVTLREAFRLVSVLAKNNKVAEIMDSYRVLQLMEHVAQSYPDDPFLPQDLKDASIHMRATFLRIVNERIDQAVQDQSVERIFNLMRIHPKNVHVQTSAIIGLNKMTSNSLERNDFAGAIIELDQSGHNVSYTLMQTLEAHVDNLELMEKLANILYVMSNNTKLCAILGKHEMVSGFLLLMTTHKNERSLLQYVIFALNGLLKIDQNKQEFLSLGGAKKILELAQNLQNIVNVTNKKKPNRKSPNHKKKRIYKTLPALVIPLATRRAINLYLQEEEAKNDKPNQEEKKPINYTENLLDLAPTDFNKPKRKKNKVAAAEDDLETGKGKAYLVEGKEDELSDTDSRLE